MWTRDYDYDHRGYPKQHNHCSKKNKKQDKEHSKKHENYHYNYHSAEVVQDADQYSNVDQESNELIFIKDSYNCCVKSTDTQVAVSLQVGLQLAIALVLRITLFDSEEGDAVAQELMQSFSTVQSNKQKIIIDNCKDVNVTTTDTDLSVNIQALLEVLLSLVATLDVA